jgi:hypothetical protein
MDKQEVIVRGQRHAYTGLWHMEPQEILNNVITKPTTSHQMEYANAVIGAPTTAFSPALSTLNNAIGNNWLFNFPGLSSKSLRKHPPQSAATAKGHLDQQRMNQRSTKTTSTVSAPHDDETSDITPTGINERSHYCFAATYEATGQIFTDQTERFVTPSSRGNNYIII